MSVEIIKKDDYELGLEQLFAQLNNIGISPSTLKNNSNDLSNICAAQFKNAAVITAEQGIKLPLNADTKRLKIPDTCQYYKIDCGNWILVFEYIGLTV